MVRISGITFCTLSARPMSTTRITGWSVSSCTTRSSRSESCESSPSKSGWMVTALSLASFMPAGKAAAITSPG